MKVYLYYLDNPPQGEPYLVFSTEAAAEEFQRRVSEHLDADGLVGGIDDWDVEESAPLVYGFWIAGASSFRPEPQTHKSWGIEPRQSPKAFRYGMGPSWSITTYADTEEEALRLLREEVEKNEQSKADPNA